jgi:hypothetical protein
MDGGDAVAGEGLGYRLFGAANILNDNSHLPPLAVIAIAWPCAYSQGISEA